MPKNAVAFLIEVLAKGDEATIEVDDGSEDKAAAAMQARQRGRNARKQRKQEAGAATAVQAARRGKDARKQVAEAKQERAEQSAAATKMQARQRGANARKAKAKEAEMDDLRAIAAA